MTESGGCAIAGCETRPDADAPLPLCAPHLLTAYDWVARAVGVTDVLPSPCLACGSRTGIRYPSGWLCAVCEWRVGALPDGEAGRTRVDVVYYLRFRDRVKIGTTGNPRARLAQLRYDEVLAFERGDRMLEQRRHAQFAAHRIHRSEWFDRHAALDEHIARLNGPGVDPWGLHQRWVSEAIAVAGR
ncbi:GIY-YIG nuclease family protein [Galbitalea soli]|uniref:GIY-YIG nuclease family protein n=1 Tax=Galbitalea soli TaxID=1268042 RepID=A0A7C9TRI8_9MICO|nr:GIY-YIG nuclease family protein [Galbitalea soli]NEM91661.1 GIY-YIG nuclease family protein [Galbitalea soli]NYJ30357.1 hypothetical protein [Galbitalea soli]